MPRYLIKLGYFGKNYAGFQAQPNAITIQGTLEKALFTYFKFNWHLTSSSRTDAGVHAKENYFHVDISELEAINITPKIIYHLNAILPTDIVLHDISLVNGDFHSRFAAQSRLYHYYITTSKNPFTIHTAYHYPYTTNTQLLHWAAAQILTNTNFIAFSKVKTEVNNFNCTILKSEWHINENELLYIVQGNRFLRGMVRALVATMLKLARGKLTQQQFLSLLSTHAIASADFSAPAHGLFLEEVNF